MKKEDYETLVNCVGRLKRADGSEYIGIKDGTPREIEKLIHDVMFDNDNDLGNLDLEHEITSDALTCLSDVELEDLPEFEAQETEDEFASVYTATRLEYLNILNQDETSEIVKEYECDIQTACAIWYDNQVKSIVEQLKDVILKN